MSSLFELRCVNKLLRLCKEIVKKPNFDPLISIPGVNNDNNIVNIAKLPLYFHSRHDNLYSGGFKTKTIVNNKKLTGHGLGSQC